MKKIFIILITLFINISIFAQSGGTSGVIYVGGNGTNSSPYECKWRMKHDTIMWFTDVYTPRIVEKNEFKLTYKTAVLQIHYSNTTANTAKAIPIQSLSTTAAKRDTSWTYMPLSDTTNNVMDVKPYLQKTIIFNLQYLLPGYIGLKVPRLGVTDGWVYISLTIQ